MNYKVNFNFPKGYFECRNNSVSKINRKEKSCLMASDIIKELKKLIDENGDKKVYVSTGSECCDAREVSTFKDGTIRIGW